MTEGEYIDMQNMMAQIGLFEMHDIGNYYTWSNKHVESIIYSMINIVLGNVSWFQDHLDTSLKILPPNVSDHALFLLTYPLNFPTPIRMRQSDSRSPSYDLCSEKV